MLVNIGIRSTIPEFIVPCISEGNTDLLISLNTVFVRLSESSSYIYTLIIFKKNEHFIIIM